MPGSRLDVAGASSLTWSDALGRAWIELLLRGFDFGLETPGHPRVGEAVGELHALLKHFDRARYLALAEKGSGFAKDPRVRFAFFGRIHED